LKYLKLLTIYVLKYNCPQYQTRKSFTY